jgi:hypothetical protein
LGSGKRYIGLQRQLPQRSPRHITVHHVNVLTMLEFSSMVIILLQCEQVLLPALQVHP